MAANGDGPTWTGPVDQRFVFSGLKVPVLAAPMFLVSGTDLVVAQSRAGVIGSFPALNARSDIELRDWLSEIRERLSPDTLPAGGTPLFAMNLIAHRTNARFEEGLAAAVDQRVPLVIASIGGRPEVAEAVHSYGGILLQDVGAVRHAHHAVEAGADVLLAIAAGAGGHTGAMSPFALIAEIRRWFDGPLGVGGAVATGSGILGSLAMGADFAYVGSPFIATEEAHASNDYKQMVVSETMAGVVQSRVFTGLDANYLRASIARFGVDPDALSGHETTPFHADTVTTDAKAWRDFWGAGHGIGAVDAVLPTARLVQRLTHEYHAASSALLARLAVSSE